MAAASTLLQHLSLAASTRRTTRSQCQGFASVCDIFGLVSFPTSPNTLVLFVAYKTLVLGHAISTTLNALSTVRREHLRLGIQLPTPGSFFPLQEAVRGARTSSTNLLSYTSAGGEVGSGGTLSSWVRGWDERRFPSRVPLPP